MAVKDYTKKKAAHPQGEMKPTHGIDASSSNFLPQMLDQYGMENNVDRTKSEFRGSSTNSNYKKHQHG